MKPYGNPNRSFKKASYPLRLQASVMAEALLLAAAGALIGAALAWLFFNGNQHVMGDVVIEREGPVERVVLNRPAVRNALTRDVVRGVTAALEAAARAALVYAPTPAAPTASAATRGATASHASAA